MALSKLAFLEMFSNAESAEDVVVEAMAEKGRTSQHADTVAEDKRQLCTFTEPPPPPPAGGDTPEASASATAADVDIDPGPTAAAKARAAEPTMSNVGALSERWALLSDTRPRMSRLLRVTVWGVVFGINRRGGKKEEEKRKHRLDEFGLVAGKVNQGGGARA